MGIAAYIKEIGRGREGARALSRAQAADLFGQVLDGSVSDLEVGAFCIAMRVKGETPEEMAGFLGATLARLAAPHLADPAAPLVVIPSYNGARKLPLLTPLLALLLARQGVAVLIHGRATENRKTDATAVLAALQAHEAAQPWMADNFATLQAGRVQFTPMHAGRVHFAPTEALCPGLARLLDVRRTVGLRNSAHSLVKLMLPVRDDAAHGVEAPRNTLLVTSYTHPEYAQAMADTFRLLGTRALLMRGTEGESVADPRRLHRIDLLDGGVQRTLQEGQSGSLAELPDLPQTIDATATALYIAQVLEGTRPVPTPIARQVDLILEQVLHPVSA